MSEQFRLSAAISHRRTSGLPSHAIGRRGSSGPTCQACHGKRTVVIGKQGAYRRRVCVACHKRFTTVEVYLP